MNPYAGLDDVDVFGWAKRGPANPQVAEASRQAGIIAYAELNRRMAADGLDQNDESGAPPEIEISIDSDSVTRPDGRAELEFSIVYKSPKYGQLSKVAFPRGAQPAGI